MTTDELETKLNEINDEVVIHIKKYNPNGGGYYALTINSHFNQYSDRLTTVKRWELDTRSSNHTWTVEHMDFYLKALKIAQDFMEENNGKG